MNLFSKRSDFGTVHYNSLLRSILLVLLIVALPVFIWAVMTQRIELRKRAATGEQVICWNRVYITNNTGYWPNGCKGDPTPQMCTQSTVQLSSAEWWNYLKWANAGKPYIPGCGMTQGTHISWRTPNALLTADDMTIEVLGKVFKGIPDPGTSMQLHSDPGTYNYTTLEATWKEQGVEMRVFLYFKSDCTSALPLRCVSWYTTEARIYNGKNPGDWFIFSRPAHDYDLNKLAAPWSQPASVPSVYQIRNTVNGEHSLTFVNLKVQPFLQQTQNATPTPTPVGYNSCQYARNGAPCSIQQCPPQPTCLPGTRCPQIYSACYVTSGTCQSGQCVRSATTPTPTPSTGCYYKQVQCFMAPCNPILVCPTPSPTTLNCTREPTFSLTPATTMYASVGGTIQWDYVLKNTNDTGCPATSYAFYMEQFPQLSNIGHLESPDFFTLTSGSVQYGTIKVISQSPTQQNAYVPGTTYKYLVRPVRAERTGTASISYLQHFAPFTRSFVFDGTTPTPPTSCTGARDGSACTMNSCQTTECTAAGTCFTRYSVGGTCSYTPGVCQSGRCVGALTPTPTCIPRPACMDPLPGQPACMMKLMPGSWICPKPTPTCIPLPECVYNPPIVNGVPVNCSVPPPPSGTSYCPRPTATPTPSGICKTGLSSFSVGSPCSDNGTFFTSASYTCYDGVKGTVGTTTTGSSACISSTNLANMAQQACAGHTSCTTPSVTERLGDLNRDGTVNLFDFNILLTNFGKTGASGFIPADLNRDGKVNLLDFNQLLKYFQ